MRRIRRTIRKRYEIRSIVKMYRSSRKSRNLEPR